MVLRINAVLQRMKTVARLLEITGFFAAFVAFAYSLAHTIEPGTTKRIVIGPLGWSISIVTLGLVLGFGAVSRGELSKRAQLLFWMFSAVFFATQAGLIHFYDFGTFGEKCQDLVAVFTPELRLGHALDAVAAFFVEVVHYWMPTVAAVSILAFILTLLRTGPEHKMQNKPAHTTAGSAPV